MAASDGVHHYKLVRVLGEGAAGKIYLALATPGG